jgi:putative protein-disulfide isomerase
MFTLRPMKLHYIHDPLCGWCYGASPLVQAARSVLPVQAHGGGMMAGARRQRVTPQLRQYVMPHDQRIAQASGQPFGDAYVDGLLRDESAVFDSEPPITAVLAADALADRGLDLLARVQKAHYVEGKRIADFAVLRDLAVELGLEGDAFEHAFRRFEGAATQAHIAQSRALLAQVGGQGFPTFALQMGERTTVVDIGSFLGQVPRWQAWLREQVALTTANGPAGPSLACSPDGCAL